MKKLFITLIIFFNFCFFAYATNYITTRLINNLGNPSGVALTIKAAVSQVANILNITDSDDVILLEVSSDGDLIFIKEGSGLSFGEISTHENAVVTELAEQDTCYQVTVFDVDGLSNNMTPDHTNDHITVVSAGKYLCVVSISFQADQVQADNFVFHVSHDNDTAEYENLHSDRTTGTLQTFGSASLSGIIDLDVSATIELWVQRTTGGGSSRDVVVRNVTLTLTQLGGT